VRNGKTTPNIKNVLDDDLNHHYLKGNGLKREAFISGRRVFGLKTEFPCVKQPRDNTGETFYVIHHMREFVRDHQLLVEPSRHKSSRDIASKLLDKTPKDSIHR
jgi:hypothetical protein